MNKTGKCLIGGAAAIVLVGAAAIADAQSPAWHMLMVRLPDGGVEHVT